MNDDVAATGAQAGRSDEERSADSRRLRDRYLFALAVAVPAALGTSGIEVVLPASADGCTLALARLAAQLDEELAAAAEVLHRAPVADEERAEHDYEHARQCYVLVHWASQCVMVARQCGVSAPTVRGRTGTVRTASRAILAAELDAVVLIASQMSRGTEVGLAIALVARGVDPFQAQRAARFAVG